MPGAVRVVAREAGAVAVLEQVRQRRDDRVPLARAERHDGLVVVARVVGQGREVRGEPSGAVGGEHEAERRHPLVVAERRPGLARGRGGAHEVGVARAVPVRVQRDGVPRPGPHRAPDELGEARDGRDVVLEHEVVRRTGRDGGPGALRGAQRAGRTVRVGVLHDADVQRGARAHEGGHVAPRRVVHDDDAQHRVADLAPRGGHPPRPGLPGARDRGPGRHGATCRALPPPARRRTRRTATGSRTASPTTFATAIVAYSAVGPPPARASAPPTPSDTAW